MARSGNGWAHAAFRYTALASTSLVSAVMAPAGSSPVILPSVCPAITRLISARAASGAAAKSASASAAAARFSCPVNSARSGSPDWTHTVFGARKTADPPSRPADTRLSPLAAASSGREDGSTCRARASSAAVWPRAPHSAIRSALATLAGEKTVLAASLASTWYRSAPKVASASGGRARRRFVSHRPYLPAQDETMAG